MHTPHLCLTLLWHGGTLPHDLDALTSSDRVRGRTDAAKADSPAKWYRCAAYAFDPSCCDADQRTHCGALAIALILGTSRAS